MHPAIHILINNHRRSLAASANAAAQLNRYRAIFGCFAGVNPQNLLGFFKQAWRSTHITGSAQAKLNGVFTARTGSEERIKCNYAIYFAQGNP
jgi:hypothetical protein